MFLNRNKQTDVINLKIKNEQIARQAKSGEITAHCKRYIEDLSTPQSRRASSIATCGSKAYMFGGISNILMNDICFFDFQTLKWNKVDFKDTEEEQKTNDDTQNETDTYAIDLQGKIINPVPEKRFAHSLVRYKNLLILYGGEEKFNFSRKKREKCSMTFTIIIPMEVYGKRYHGEKNSLMEERIMLLL